MRIKDNQLKEERKSQILDSALTLFCKQGFSKTSMNDIVKHSGISKGGIYYYFQTKEEIFYELAENILQNRKKISEQFPESMNAVEKFRQFIIQIISGYQNKEYHKDIRFGFEFWNDKKSSIKINGVSKKEFLDKRFKKASAQLTSIIKEGIKKGEFRNDININDFLFSLHATIDGTAFFVGLLERKLTKNKIFMIADIYCSYLLNE